MPGYGPWARLAYFRGSSEKGERVRGLIVPQPVSHSLGTLTLKLIAALTYAILMWC